MRLRRKRKPAEISIVPLVDVLIVLIFFFLMSMQFKTRTTLNLTLPKIETAGANKLESRIEIGVNEEGQFFYNGVLLDEAGLEDAIKLAAGISKEQTVMLMADEESALKNVAKAMDLCRKHGLESIRLQSR